MSGPERAGAQAASIFGECYELILLLYQYVRGFPKSQKFVLGQRMEATGVDLLARIIEANMERRKGPKLKQASVELEKLRIFARLAKDLAFLDFKKYEVLSAKVDTVGRMLGGWTKWAEAES